MNFPEIIKAGGFDCVILDLSNPTQKAQHDRIVQLVDQMLSTQKKLQETGCTFLSVGKV